MALPADLPEDERLAVERHLREFDRLGDDLKVIERDLARSALADEGVKRLMTIPGVDMVVALAHRGRDRRRGALREVAEAGQLSRASTQACGNQVRDRLITAGSPSRAAVMPAACSSRQPGRQHGRRVRCAAFFLRVRTRRGQHVAAVATARKLAVADLASADQERELPLGPSSPACQKAARSRTQGRSQAARGQKGTAHAYNLKSQRDQERRWVEQAEAAYARFVAGWRPRGPKARTGAAKEERR